MARVKRGVVVRAKHKGWQRRAKGYYGCRKSNISVARSAVEKGWLYSYRDRRNRKRFFRSLWIQRINAAVRSIDPALTYSRLIGLLSKADVIVDRKVLADIAISHPEDFKRLVGIAVAA